MATGNPTKSKFGVEMGDGTRGTILMPKLQYRFRVRFVNFGSFSNEDDMIITQNVISVKRPSLELAEVELDSYNSKVWVQGKHTWSTVQLVVRDDITNRVASAVGKQVQKQFNHYEQTTPAIATDYKFTTYIEVLDGTDISETEAWFLEGCWLKNVDYSEHNYSTNDPVTITMEIRYDNATQLLGDGTVNGRIFPQTPFTPNPTVNIDGRIA